ncbi:MAG: NADH-quinone oxidoreductase subunit C [Deltaproteobacteria bacterium]|nr:NADH-quinone oxidoreductase subunit C [Deltaproteobacteria bacterium]MCX7952582.1 NADH-quinone oxidoreductase subunit C [Deltaproteobacteria bacterium]
MLSAEQANATLELIRTKLGSLIQNDGINLGIPFFVVKPEDLPTIALILKEDVECKFCSLVDITACDYPERDPRFDVVYQFLSIPYKTRLTLKTRANLTVPTLTNLYQSANFLEREVYDMFGIKFEGHKDLRRILLYEEFQGHPLRKDYPVRGKQPRIPLRYPEVPNTSGDLSRVPLAEVYIEKINKKKQI